MSTQFEDSPSKPRSKRGAYSQRFMPLLTPSNEGKNRRRPTLQQVRRKVDESTSSGISSMTQASQVKATQHTNSTNSEAERKKEEEEAEKQRLFEEQCAKINRDNEEFRKEEEERAKRPKLENVPTFPPMKVTWEAPSMWDKVAAEFPVIWDSNKGTDLPKEPKK